MHTKHILILAIPVLFVAWCASSLRWSTTFTEDVVLSNGEKIQVTRTTHFRQAGSDTTLGFGRGGVAREWSISFRQLTSTDQKVTWDFEDRIPVLLDIDGKTGRSLIVSVKPFSNGSLGDHHWPDGSQNPYYVYKLIDKTWEEVPFDSDFIGRKNNLLVRFDHFYVKSPTPRSVGHVTLEEKEKLQEAQDDQIRVNRDVQKLKYRVIGPQVPNSNVTANEPSRL